MTREKPCSLRNGVEQLHMGERSTHYDFIRSGPKELSRLLKKQKQEEIANWDEEKTSLQHARRRKGIFDVSSEDTEYLKVISEARATLEKCADIRDIATKCTHACRSAHVVVCSVEVLRVQELHALGVRECACGVWPLVLTSALGNSYTALDISICFATHSKLAEIALNPGQRPSLIAVVRTL